MSVPALRFNEFSGDWDENKLGDIADLTSSKRVYLSDYVSEGIPFYRGKEISELKRNETPKDILYITTKAYNAFKASYGVPQVDDILITAVGTLGNVYRIKDDSEFYFKDGNLIWLRDIKISSAFLEILFETNNEAIQKSSIGSTQRALTIVELKKLKFSIPSLPEQTKIANFLTAVDEKISILNQKAKLLSQYKKGVMQQIFSQELRFKDDDGQEFPEWEEKTLKDMLDIVIDNRGKTPPTENIGNPLLEVNSIGKKDINFKVVGKFVSDTTYHSWFRKHIKNGDILFSTVGATAQCSYFQDEQTNATIAQNIVGLRFKNIYNSLFMFYMLTEKKNNQKFKTIEMGAVQPSVKVSQMIHLFFSIPSLPEQTKIANFLTAIDEKITTNQTQLNALKQYKQGLLQQMFV